jgi:hypothetical protein
MKIVKNEAHGEEFDGKLGEDLMKKMMDDRNKKIDDILLEAMQKNKVEIPMDEIHEYRFKPVVCEVTKIETGQIMDFYYNNNTKFGLFLCRITEKNVFDDGGARIEIDHVFEMPKEDEKG